MSTQAIDRDNDDKGFVQWLADHLGETKWIVARRSARRAKDGFDRFFTQKKYRALQSAYEQEQEAMSDQISTHLTEPNKELEAQRKRTPAGMAFWSGTGPENTKCRMCAHWLFDGYLVSTGLLRDAPCDKYARMINAMSGPRIPHFTASCKYFEASEKIHPIEEPKSKHAA